MSAAVYLSATSNIPPVWDGTFKYQVDSRSVNSKNIAQPKIHLLSGYMAGNVFVSGAFNDTNAVPQVYSPLPGASGFATLTPLATTWLIELTPDHTAVVRSVVSVVLDPGQLISAFKPFALAYLSCDTNTVDTLLNQLFAYADLRSDAPSFLDQTKECDVVSLVFEMDLQPIAAPTDVADGVNVPDPCADAGVDGAGGGG